MGFLDRFSHRPGEPSVGESANTGDRGKEFTPSEVPYNVAEGMSLEELRQVLDDLEEKINKGEDVDVEHYNKLKEIYERRTSASQNKAV